jgi:hypothetical protein
LCYQFCATLTPSNVTQANTAAKAAQTPNAQVDSHAQTFAKVLDGRKQAVRGLWQRGAVYAQLSVEDFSTGEKRVRRVPLVNSDGNPVEKLLRHVG